MARLGRAVLRWLAGARPGRAVRRRPGGGRGGGAARRRVGGEPLAGDGPEPYGDRADAQVPPPGPARRDRRARALALVAGSVVVLAAVAGLRHGAPPGPTADGPRPSAAAGQVDPGPASYTLLAHTGHRLVRAERRGDSRSVVSVSLPSAPGDVQTAWVTQVATVVALPVAEPGGSVRPVVVVDGAVTVLAPARAVFRGPGGASIWVAQVGQDRRERLAELGLDGRVESAPRLVPAGWRVAAVRRGGVVLERTDGSHRLALWLDSDAVRDLGVRGQVEHSAGAHLLVDTGPAWVVVDLQSGTRTTLHPPPALELLTPPVVSRDGALVAAVVRERSLAGRGTTSLAVGTVTLGAADLSVRPGTEDTGSHTLPVTPAWAADGQVYGVLSGAVYCYRPGERAAWRLPGPVPPLRRIWAY